MSDDHPGAGLPPGARDVPRDADGRPSHFDRMTFGAGPTSIPRGSRRGRASSRRRGWLGMALWVTIGAILAVAIVVGYVLLLGIGPA